MTAEQISGLAPAFTAFLSSFKSCFGRRDTFEHLGTYCRGLISDLPRKSVEPMAAHLDPLNASAKHQSLHHFIAKARWSDACVMQRVRE